MCKPSPWDTALGQHSHTAGASARALPGAAGTQSSCGVSVTSLRGAGTLGATTSPLPMKVGVLCSVADELRMQFLLTTPRTGPASPQKQQLHLCESKSSSLFLWWLLSPLLMLREQSRSCETEQL